MKGRTSMVAYNFGVGVIAACTAIVMYLYLYMWLRRDVEFIRTGMDNMLRYL